jgi:DNA polymerase III subunit gamma/tau
MATQSLYRRYRPRRFSELKGQPHVVRALQTAVINHREGQAYLFSGPRGTGKTTSARILAKVLNCENSKDGEPCCECASCLAVEAGTSYDVHELDAASNNGVDAMRDLIEKASLGTPGRHKVYILDEVHMLSRPAEAALLKTLEEPPPHVVFVLATTDPQKISDTIRSRTQHLQFHLLPAEVLEEHVRWVAEDAGIALDDSAIAAVVRQGGGSARDTLSSLELVASSGGIVDDGTPVDEFVEALEAADAARVLAAIAFSIQQGRDPRALTEDLLRHLRDCFLSLMAPELVQLPASRLDQIGAQASRLGAAQLVKAMEVLGETLVEMRHAPDPRVLVEVALVRLTHRELDSGVEALAGRIEQLEREVARLQAAGPAPAAAPIDPATGKAKLGSRVTRPAAAAAAPPATAASPTPAPAAAPVPRRPDTPPAAEGDAEPSDGPSADGAGSGAVPAPAARPATNAPTGQRAAMGSAAGAGGTARPVGRPVDTTAPTPRPAEPAAVAPAPATGGTGNAAAAVRGWTSDVLPALKPLVRAIYAAATLVGEREGAVAVSPPNDAHLAKCEQHRAAVEAAIAAVAGGPVPLRLVVDNSGGGGGGATPPAGRPTGPPDDDPYADAIDPNELTDAPPTAMQSPIERLTEAFPGSELLEG